MPPSLGPEPGTTNSIEGRSPQRGPLILRWIKAGSGDHRKLTPQEAPPELAKELQEARLGSLLSTVSNRLAPG